MIKKFFSILLLATSMIISTLSAESLFFINNTKSVISNITLTFAQDIFSSTNDICVSSLQEGQQGTSNLDNLQSIKIYTVTYEVNGVKITENYKGEVFYLPAKIELGNVPQNPIIIKDNDVARQQAKEDEVLNRAAVLAGKAKNQVVDTVTNTKNWLVGAGETVAEKAKSAANTVVQTVSGKAEEVKQDAEAAAQKAGHTTKEIAQEMKHNVEETATQIKHRAEEAAQKAKHTAQEATTKAVDTVKEIIS